jgi:hypothetical protein
MSTTMRALGLLVVGALGAACSAATAPSDPNRVAGFDPPPPAAGEVQIFSPIVRSVPPGGDLLYCSYIANPFGDKEVDVVAATGLESRFGHHALLMSVNAGFKAGDSHVCTDGDMNDARFLAGASDAASNVDIPSGIGFRIKPGGVILVQTHWINSSSQPIDGQAAFNVALRPPDSARQNAQLFASLTSDFKVPAHGPAHAVGECVIQEPLQFFTLGGHEHELGTHVTIDKVAGGTTTNLYDQEWKPEYQSNPPRNHYPVDAPLTLAKGDVLRITCDWKNAGDQDVVFPREMCVVFGMVFPATHDVHCQDGVWTGLP